MKTKEKALAGVGLAIPLGYVVWEATRRKNGVRIEGVGIEAAGELPVERTWRAITVVVEEPPTGEIVEAVVWNRTANRRYYSADFPVTIPSEHKVAVAAIGRNTTNRTLRLRMRACLFDPAGARRGSSSFTANVPPGERIPSRFTPDVPLDREGTWTIKAELREV